jgi:(R,R)-butanediol dehydrogenase/meso-butanediol dehydrogenase/diacetyl reductase
VDKSNEIELKEVPIPQPKEGWALVKTSYGGICGSDITIKSGKHPRAKAPLILGHELSGTIVKLNGNSNLAEGDRVVLEPLLSCGECKPCKNGFDHVCENLKLLGVETDGGFAQYFVAPIQRLYKISSAVTDQQAALAEPLAVAVHSVNYANPKADSKAVVIGAGPIGLLIALVLKARGVSSIYVSEIDDHRLKLAQILGLKTIDAKKEDPVKAVLDLTEGKGCDLTFDAAGFPAVGMQIIPMTAIKGKIIMSALHKQPCEVFFRDLSYKEVLIQGVRIYAKGDFKEAVELLETKKVDVEPLISHQFSSENYKEAFAAAQNSSESCKVIIGF